MSHSNGHSKFESFIANLYLARLSSALPPEDWQKGVETAAGNDALLRTLGNRSHFERRPPDVTKPKVIETPIVTDSPEMIFTKPK